MSISYNCRYCGVHIGQIDKHAIDMKDLGFDHLSNEERVDMIEYQSTGGIQVKAICEDCHEALQRNPSFHELENFIQ